MQMTSMGDFFGVFGKYMYLVSTKARYYHFRFQHTVSTETAMSVVIFQMEKYFGKWSGTIYVGFAILFANYLFVIISTN